MPKMSRASAMRGARGAGVNHAGIARIYGFEDRVLIMALVEG
jgi:hypothetical protein